MTAKDAYKLVNKRYVGMVVVECYEYDSVYSFNLIPSGLKKSGIKFDALACVDKSTGVVRTFKPFDISVEEYKRGKKVPKSLYEGG